MFIGSCNHPLFQIWSKAVIIHQPATRVKQDSMHRIKLGNNCTWITTHACAHKFPQGSVRFCNVPQGRPRFYTVLQDSASFCNIHKVKYECVNLTIWQSLRDAIREKLKCDHNFGPGGWSWLMRVISMISEKGGTTAPLTDGIQGCFFKPSLHNMRS